ncbi:MAG: acyltransferase family protein [Spirochaetales bacterium]|nr:acyltransferase family protein [Spirochaetales bacterium]
MKTIQLNKTNETKREYYIDWLRDIVVLILIPFHTAVSFSHIGKGYTYTAAADNSWLFIFISDFFNLWIMRLLFFISGMSVFMSLKKRKTQSFIKDRFKRLVIPVLFQLLITGPIAGYILAIGRDNFSDSFLSFYPQFFIQSKKYLFWGHMWYCVYLFNFSIILLPLLSTLLRKPELAKKINIFLIRKNNILLPMIIIIFFEAILRPQYPGYQSFIGDWANVVTYSLFFIIGFIVVQTPAVFEVITQKRIFFLISAVCMTTAFLFCKRKFFIEADLRQLSIIAALWGAAAYCWVMSLIGFFKKYLNHNSSGLRYLSKTSFSLYIFHYLILSVFNFFLLKTKLSNLLIWTITSLGTYIVFALFFELILKRSKIMCYICGIK